MEKVIVRDWDDLKRFSENNWRLRLSSRVNRTKADYQTAASKSIQYRVEFERVYFTIDSKDIIKAVKCLNALGGNFYYKRKQ